MNFFFIRGLCALGVFINHFNNLVHGFIFVWIFFQVSGYLLSKKLDKEKISYLKFLKNRAKRLLPTYYFVQITTIIIIIFFLDQNLYDKTFYKELIALFIPFHIPNFYNTMFIFNSVLWSLQLEIYFVLIIYFLFKNIKVIISVVVFSILLHIFYYLNNLNIFPNHYPSFFYNIIFFMSGVLAYFFRKYFQFKLYFYYFFLILLFLSIFKIENNILLSKLPLLFVILITPVIPCFDNNEKAQKYGKNLMLNFFVFLGVISYPFYLIHKIILKLLFEKLSFLDSSLLGFSIILSLVIIISYLLHICVEKKFRY